MPSAVINFSPGVPPPALPPRKLSGLELALQSLQSLEMHFRCGICYEMLEETHLEVGSVCIHRYCAKCLDVNKTTPGGMDGNSCGLPHPNSFSQHEYAAGAYPPLTHASILPKKDTNFDHVIRKTMEAMKYLQEYDASIKEQEAYNLANTVSVPPRSPSSSGDGSSDEYESDESTGTGTGVDIGIGPSIGIDAGIGCLQQETNSSSNGNTTLQNTSKREYSSLTTFVPEKEDRHHELVVLSGMNNIQQMSPDGPQGGRKINKIPRIQGAAADILQRSRMLRENMMTITAPATNTGTIATKIPGKKRVIKSFQDRIKELQDFKEIHGHVNVPSSHPSLGMWCNHVRVRYKQQKEGKQQTGGIALTPERIQILNDIGFEWNRNKPFEERLADLKKFKEAEGNCDVPFDHPTLGQWFKGLKKNYKLLMNGNVQSSGTILSLERVKKLEAIGVEWFPVKKSFDNRVQELVEFKKCYGHFKVPYKHPSLGVWCHNARQSHKRLMEGKSQQCGMRMTPARIAKLDEIGFFD